jgi:hypothetical protein
MHTSQPQFEPIYMSKGQLLHSNGAQMPVGQVLYTASGQPVYAPLSAQPLYHTPVYATQPIYASGNPIPQQIVQPIYANGSTNAELYAYEAESQSNSGTLGRQKSVCKTRPVAKVAAKTREDYAQQVIKAPEKQNSYSNDSNDAPMSSNLDKVAANNFINHMQNSQLITSQQQMINSQHQQIIYTDQSALPNPNVCSIASQQQYQQMMSHQQLMQQQMQQGLVYTNSAPIASQQLFHQQQQQQQLHLQLQQMHLPIEPQHQQPTMQQLNNSYIYATLKRKKLPPPIPKRTNSMRSGCNTAPTTPLLPPSNSSSPMMLQRRGSLDDCSQLNGLLPLSLPPPTSGQMTDRDFMQEQAFATCVKSLTTRFSLNAKALEQAHDASVAATIANSSASTMVVNNNRQGPVCNTVANQVTNETQSVSKKPVDSSNIANDSTAIGKDVDDKMADNTALRRNVKESGTVNQLQRISSGSSNCSSSLSTLCSSSGVSSLSSGVSNCETGSCGSSLNGQSRTPSATSSECIASHTCSSDSAAIATSTDCNDDFPPPPSPSVLPIDQDSESSGPSSLEALPPPPPPPAATPPPPTASTTSSSFSSLPHGNAAPAAQVTIKNTVNVVSHFVNPLANSNAPCTHNECCVSSSSSTDSMPFANDNIGTLKAKPGCANNACYQRQMAMFATGSESSGSLTASISSTSSSGTASTCSSAVQTPLSPSKQASWPCSPVKQMLPIEMVPNVNHEVQFELHQQPSKPDIPARTCSTKADALPVKIASVAPQNVIVHKQSPNLCSPVRNEKPVLKSLPLLAPPQVLAKPVQSIVQPTIASLPVANATSQNGYVLATPFVSLN